MASNKDLLEVLLQNGVLNKAQFDDVNADTQQLDLKAKFQLYL